MPPTLSLRLDAALLAGSDALDGLAEALPVDRRDALLTLLAIHDLHTGSVDALGDRVRWQHHPAVARLKWRLEQSLLAWLEAEDRAVAWDLPEDPVAAMRALGARG